MDVDDSVPATTKDLKFECGKDYNMLVTWNNNNELAGSRSFKWLDVCTTDALLTDNADGTPYKEPAPKTYLELHNFRPVLTDEKSYKKYMGAKPTYDFTEWANQMDKNGKL